MPLLIAVEVVDAQPLGARHPLTADVDVLQVVAVRDQVADEGVADQELAVPVENLSALRGQLLAKHPLGPRGGGVLIVLRDLYVNDPRRQRREGEDEERGNEERADMDRAAIH